jgi:VIT1/CCC1 family predicted Fe2+/Mn2+ transporter
MVLVTNMCPACGHELIQKNRPLLSLAGAAFLIAAIPLLFFHYVWIVAIVTAAAGLYLLFWSVLGKGKWCRRCKKFPVSKTLAG